MKRKWLKVIAVGVGAGFIAPLHAAGETGKKKWKDTAEVAIVSSNGNTKTTTSSGKNTFLYNWTRASLELIAGGLGTKSQGEVTAERYFAGEKFTHKITGRNYALEKFFWETDRFSGVRHRYDSSLGLGRELVRRPMDALIAELGAGYISEQRVRPPSKDFGFGRAYAKYTRTLSETANFSQDAEYLHNFDDRADFRAKTESALTASLSTNLALKVAYVWKHVGRPPPGFSRNDTTTTVALVANY